MEGVGERGHSKSEIIHTTRACLLVVIHLNLEGLWYTGGQGWVCSLTTQEEGGDGTGTINHWGKGTPEGKSNAKMPPGTVCILGRADILRPALGMGR